MTAGFSGRREDHRLLTGRGRYTNDQNLPGQLHAMFRRSDRAHARLRSVDKSVAERASGVAAYLGDPIAVDREGLLAGAVGNGATANDGVVRLALSPLGFAAV